MAKTVSTSSLPIGLTCRKDVTRSSPSVTSTKAEAQRRQQQRERDDDEDAAQNTSRQAPPPLDAASVAAARSLARCLTLSERSWPQAA